MSIKTITINKSEAEDIRKTCATPTKVGSLEDQNKKRVLSPAEKRNRYLTHGRGRGLASIGEIARKAA